jgi:long-chain acyl-CoA synthetase
VSDWASRNNVAYTGFTSLARNAEVIRLIGREIDAANKSLSRVEQVKAFRIIPKILDPEEEGEPITPTRKVKRRFMYLKFRDLVESMYSHDEEERLHKAVGEVLVH